MNLQVSITELLHYLTGESSEDEARHVQVWSRLHAANAAMLEALRYGGDEDVAQLKVDVAHGLERLQSRLNGTLVPRGSVPHHSDVVGLRARQQGVFKRQPLLRMASVILSGVMTAILLLVIGWYFVDRHFARRPETSPGVYTTYITSSGQRIIVPLPDGNTVVLNGASQLEIPTTYAAGQHMIRLPVGEALFTVLHHRGTPLTVVSGGLTTHVLGTRFVVRHYQTDTVTTVAVADGKVTVGGAVVTAHQSLEVSPAGGMQLRAADPTQFRFATAVSQRDSGGWDFNNGLLLTFDNLPLSKAVSELDRWYHREFRLGDTIVGRQRITGNFVGWWSSDDLAHILESRYQLKVVHDGRVWTLYTGRTRIAGPDTAWSGCGGVLRGRNSHGVLSLDGMRFSQAIPSLDCWFMADIRLGDPRLGARRITASLSRGSLSDLTTMLELMYNVRVVRSGRVITLYPYPR